MVDTVTDVRNLLGATASALLDLEAGAGFLGPTLTVTVQELSSLTLLREARQCFQEKPGGQGRLSLAPRPWRTPPCLLCLSPVTLRVQPT